MLVRIPLCCGITLIRKRSRWTTVTLTICIAHCAENRTNVSTLLPRWSRCPLPRMDDYREATEAVVHKYDAFLNLLCADRYAFQRDAVREALRFLISDKYADLERLARENWNARVAIQQRHEGGISAYLDRMPLKDRKAVSLDLATGTGKSFVMYALAAIALAEGIVDRVLVLCPSLTIEEGSSVGAVSKASPNGC
jgi:hypothetical protein